ncbi:MAG TPA: hypothetical protein VFG30_41000 [Polyangiales bacterium]|nr:hypothetical protein [Polyangiales bacterium]
MSFNCNRHARHFRLVLGVSLLSGCAAGELDTSNVGVWSGALELECAAVPANVTGDVISILSSVEPVDPSQPQAYGSEHCAGVIFEFDNPEDEPLRGAWVQASGESMSSSDVFSESRCPERALEAEYWGYKDREWSLLAFASNTAGFEPGPDSQTGYCGLDALIESPGTFEKLRIVARVTQGSDTYPMYACLW